MTRKTPMDPLFEKLNSVNTMMDAEHELVSLGEAAVGRLEILFDGTSRNQCGIPYSDLGLPLHCALEIALRLGPIAKPLEPYIAAELPGSETAARALGTLGYLAPSSVEALALALEADIFVASEAARVLVQHGEDRSPLVERIEQRSAAAHQHLDMARRKESQTDA